MPYLFMMSDSMSLKLSYLFNISALQRFEYCTAPVNHANNVYAYWQQDGDKIEREKIKVTINVSIYVLIPTLAAL